MGNIPGHPEAWLGQAEVFLDLVDQTGAEFLLTSMHWQLRALIAPNDRDMTTAAFVVLKGAAPLSQPTAELAGRHETNIGSGSLGTTKMLCPLAVSLTA